MVAIGWPCLALWAAMVVALPAGCGRMKLTGDGSVPDEPEPAVDVDLGVWKQAQLAIPADEASPDAFSNRLAAVGKVAAAMGRSGEMGGRRRGETTSGGSDVGPVSTGWEVQFPRGNTVETYARVLDFFGFELGVMQPNGKILYVYSLSKEKPDTRTGPASAEKRCYLSWTRGDLGEADAELLSRAGVDIADKVVLKFIRPEIEALLTEIAKGHAGDAANRIERTRFGVRRKRDGYDFFVLEQNLRGG
jgi:hypothetical protein